jgi:hypothetical protein
MAVILWWRGRLVDRRPLREDKMWVQDVSFKAQYVSPEDPWPRAIAKAFLLLDYRQWFEEVYLEPYRQCAFYQDQPDQLPKPATDLEFWTTLSPLIHLVGRAQQTRSYNVKEQHLHMDVWVTIKVKKNFIRLLEWGEHVAAFELQTGSHLAGLHMVAPKPRIEMVAKGVTVVVNRMATNKANLDRTMGKP